MTIGILALQGGFALHKKKFNELGIQTRLIVCPEELVGISGLVLPGGESSSMLKNMSEILWNRIKAFSSDYPVWGVCAGSVLLAKHVENPTQSSLGILDIIIQRNAYGSQNDSFTTKVRCKLGMEFNADCIFIRAPKILKTGEAVTILAEHNGAPIMVEQNSHIVTTFHPELSDEMKFHEYFLEKTNRKQTVP